MSAKIMGRAWDLDLPHNQLLVLLALADHADHEGNNVYPSLGLVAWKTGYSEQQVRRVIRDLVKLKILVVVEKSPGRTIKYKIAIDAGTMKAAYTPIRMIPLSKSNPLQSDTTDPLQNVTPTPNMLSAKNVAEPSVEPSIEPFGATKAAKDTNKGTIPAALMNPMKDAIVAAFGWTPEKMTRGEWGIVQATAKELCGVGFETDRVASLYAWCKAKFTSFTPKAMATHLSEYRATRLDKPVATNKPLTEAEYILSQIQAEGSTYGRAS